MALTDAWLKAHHRKEHDAVVERADREGLSARVTRKGKVVFQIRYRYQGKPARMDIGTYPGMTLKQARDEALKRRTQLEQGHDPRKMKHLEQNAILEAHTNKTLLLMWYERYCSVQKAAATEILRSFELHVFPEIGDLPADQTTVSRWLDVLEPLAMDKPRIAERVLANAKQAHKWAARRELIENQPLASISAKDDLHVNRQRDKGRALSDDELRIIWRAMDRTRMALRSKIFVKLCLFYGCRPGELRTARRDEFDLEGGVWTIPPERHKVGKKTGRPLIRPVIDEVKPWLQEAMSLSHNPELLFSGERDAAEINDRSVICFPYSIMRAAKNQMKIDMQHWSMYDLRKTARTNWSTLTEPHISELMLGHKLPGVWQVYDRHDYLEEQAVAYRAWWERLTRLLADPPTL